MSMYKAVIKDYGMWVGGMTLASWAFTKIVTKGPGDVVSVNPKWQAATKEYMKVQQMNPIGLGGRRAWDPEYLHKE